MRCDECRFWSDTTKRDPLNRGTLRICARTADCNEVTDVRDKAPYLGQTAFTEDPTGAYYASFWTRPEHSCGMFQPKEA